MNETTLKYEMIDSGDGEKLERFGAYVLRRPDPEVLWKKNKSADVWDAADASFLTNGLSKKWSHSAEATRDEDFSWVATIEGLQFKLDLGSFKHVGIFPEQAAQWEWMVGKVTSHKALGNSGEKKIKILNLFGYTGGATVALAQAGCEVTHVDALESNLTRTKENLTLNNLVDSSVRLIADDVRKFVEKEIRRGVKYDGIIMDPPVYGKGSKKEQWHIEEDLLPLLSRSVELLSDAPLFFVVSGYASQYSHLAYKNALSGSLPSSATIESGELIIKESDTQRLLPAGIFSRATF